MQKQLANTKTDRKHIYTTRFMKVDGSDIFVFLHPFYDKHVTLTHNTQLLPTIVIVRIIYRICLNSKASYLCVKRMVDF